MLGLWDVYLLLECIFSRHMYALLSVSHHAANKDIFAEVYISQQVCHHKNPLWSY